MLDSDKPVAVVMKSKKGETTAQYYDGKMQITDTDNDLSKDDNSVIIKDNDSENNENVVEIGSK